MTVVGLVNVTAQPIPPSSDRRIALVIGNSAYQNLGSLSNPRNDATAMARQLRQAGFELVGDRALLDLDKLQMERAVRDFGRSLRQGAVGLFYFAGHGVQSQGRNFILPVSASISVEADIPFEGIDADLVLRQLEASGTRLSIVVLDACRNLPVGGATVRSASSGLAQMQAAYGTIISFAAQPGAMAQDGPPDGNSPFTAALLDRMRAPGLNVLDVFNEVGVIVSQSTARLQQPWVSSSPVEGRFFFTPPVEITSEPPPVPAPTLAPQSPQPQVTRVDPAAIELSLWQTAISLRTVSALEEYLRQYPNGQFAPMARIQIEELRRQSAMAPSAAGTPGRQGPRAAESDVPSRTRDEAPAPRPPAVVPPVAAPASPPAQPAAPPTLSASPSAPTAPNLRPPPSAPSVPTIRAPQERPVPAPRQPQVSAVPVPAPMCRFSGWSLGGTDGNVATQMMSVTPGSRCRGVNVYVGSPRSGFQIVTPPSKGSVEIDGEGVHFYTARSGTSGEDFFQISWWSSGVRRFLGVRVTILGP